MIKASALFYSIVISLVIAILSGSLLLLFYFNRLELLSNIDSEKVERDCLSGINILLSDTTANSNENKLIDLYGNGTDSVLLKKKEWGTYELLISKAYIRGKKSIKIAEVGSDTANTNKIALYLPESIYPLALCGKTVIKGNCYLSKSGVKRGYIEGETFTGTDLINGDIKNSTDQLPAINDSIVSKIKFLLSGNIESTGFYIQKDINNIDTFYNSFLDTTAIMYSSSPIDLSSKFIKGNIIIRSDKLITVEQNTVLQDVILSAPVIEITDFTESNFQAFASDSLIVGNSIKLDYPSSLGILRTTSSPDIPVLKLGQNDEIYGAVLAYQDKFQSNQTVSIKIPESAVINGLVFSNGTVEDKGVIYGSLICNKIMLKTPSSIYESYLLNATIDRSKLSNSFVQSFLLTNHGNSKIAKWLY